MELARRLTAQMQRNGGPSAAGLVVEARTRVAVPAVLVHLLERLLDLALLDAVSVGAFDELHDLEVGELLALVPLVDRFVSLGWCPACHLWFPFFRTHDISAAH